LFSSSVLKKDFSFFFSLVDRTKMFRISRWHGTIGILHCSLFFLKSFPFFSLVAGEDEDLSNLTLAWYYAGYYTALFRAGRSNF